MTDLDCLGPLALFAFPGQVNGRFNSAVGLIAACREAEVGLVGFVETGSFKEMGRRKDRKT